jgi:hypothetical protein
MDRRQFVMGSLAMGAATHAMAQENALRVAARQAFLYALPLTEIALIRGRLLATGLPAGAFFPQKGVATPNDRFVTTPNNDTIYANAFIDLRHTPATLKIPSLGERYASLYLMDMFSNEIAVLGTRATGQQGGTFTLVGPTDAAPPGALRSPTPWVWAMARVLVNGTDDVQTALAVLHQFGCEGTPAKPMAAPGADRNGPWQAWFNAANGLLMENPPPATDEKILHQMAPLGLGSAAFDPTKFSTADAAEIAAGVADAKTIALSAGFGGAKVGQWLYPAPDMGVFGQDYVTRARIAVSGLAALPTAEAMYLTAFSPEGSPAFQGDGLWRLRFAKDAMPPVDAFWSLTMYEREANGALFLTPNSANRYSIGDRTPGLTREADGGLTIWIGRTDPGGDRAANWLPAPAKGPFVMILRTYMPRSELVMQRYVPPAVEKV